MLEIKKMEKDFNVYKLQLSVGNADKLTGNQLNSNSSLTALLDKITSAIDQFIVGELNLPELEMDVALSCPDTKCDGQLTLMSKGILLEIRKKSTGSNTQEKHSLSC